MARARKRKNLRADSSSAVSRRWASLKPIPADMAPADSRLVLTVSIFVLAASSWLLFFHLGAYCFWGDEADTVLFGRGVARTGDTLAVIDQNVYAFGNGALLKNLHGRYQPPLQNYLVAPFVGRSGTGTLWPRVPFATCGVLTVALLLYWLWKARVSAAYWIAFSLALLGNVSFFLFDRQCRYYAVSTLLAVTITYLYLNWRGQRRVLAGIVIASILLICTSYLAHAALYVALGCDYLLFQRRRKAFTLGQIAMVLAPQIVVELILLSIYNPLTSTVISNLNATIPKARPGNNPFWDHLTIVWHFFRDLNNSELCVGLIVLAAPVLYFWSRNIWLLRGAAAIAVYTLAIALLQPFPLASSFMASVRYLSDEIPLCIALSALVIVTIAKNRWQIAPLAALIFGSTVLNFPFSPSHWRCRPFDFVQEVCNPRETSIARSARWIDEHMSAGQSIWVMPPEMRYPLMYAAPKVVYAWQLTLPVEEQFAKLPPIHIFGQAWPDYFLMFGPEKAEGLDVIDILKSVGVEYELVEVLDIFWNDEIRAEVFWRRFYPIQKFNKDLEAVYIYRRTN